MSRALFIAQVEQGIIPMSCDRLFLCPATTQEDHRDLERFINIWMPFVYSDEPGLGAEAEDYVERLGRLVDLDYSKWGPLEPDPEWPGCDLPSCQ